MKKWSFYFMGAVSYLSLSYGAEVGRGEREEFISRSPVSFYSGDSDTETGISSGSLSSDDEEERSGERKKARVKQAKAFFEQKIKRDSSSDSESKGESPVSHRHWQTLLKKEGHSLEDEKRNRALRALSKRLDKIIEKWSSFVGVERKEIEAALEKGVSKFSEEAPLLAQKMTPEDIKVMIQAKASKVKGSAITRWEVWGGKED